MNQMSKLKIILDTNIIISAFLFQNSKPRQVLEIAKNEHLVLLSNNIIQELKTVIRRTKFDRYISLIAREELLQTFILLCTLRKLTHYAKNYINP
jgi:hypothetical protein